MTDEYALAIVLDLARENMIDPREGDDYQKIRDEQEKALEIVSTLLDANLDEVR